MALSEESEKADASIAVITIERVNVFVATGISLLFVSSELARYGSTART